MSLYIIGDITYWSFTVPSYGFQFGKNPAGDRRTVLLAVKQDGEVDGAGSVETTKSLAIGAYHC